ncbi:MAG: hypothetical protein ACTHXA_08595 [Gulosibacter sp.]|uniref:hypothetical protein n=1 Tax=Gulosibacter sp. TaxID=2817531 RepID=UPI003F914E60
MNANPADERATVAAAFDAAAQALDLHLEPSPHVIVERMTDPRPPTGWAAWRVPGTTHPVVVTRALRDDAPEELRRRYAVRLLASLTGACSACGAAASTRPEHIDPDTEAVVAAPVEHEAECVAVFTEADAQHFDDEEAQR